MNDSFNRDNFARFGIDKKNYDKDKALEWALGKNDSDDKEIDTKKTRKK